MRNTCGSLRIISDLMLNKCGFMNINTCGSMRYIYGSLGCGFMRILIYGFYMQNICGFMRIKCGAMRKNFLFKVKGT